MSTPTPTDPREEKLTIRDCIMRRFAKVATPTWEALCQLEADEISKGKALEIIRNEAELMERENWKLLQAENAELESTNSNLAAEVERQNVILLSHSKAVGEFACGAPSVPDALRKLAAEIAELRDKLADIGCAAIGADVEPAEQPGVLKIVQSLRTELETAKLTLFQTEKRLDGKLRTALAELEAARKERDAYQNDGRIGGAAAAYERVCKSLGLTGDLLGYFQRLSADRDTAEKRVRDLERTIEDAPHSQHCKFIPPILRTEMQDASGMFDCTCWKHFTPAPTQEPPAVCPKCYGFGWIRIGDPGKRCDCKLNPPAGGVTISNDSVNSETQLGPKGHVTAEGANSGQSADPGAVTISTVEKERDHWKATAELHYNARLELERERDRKGGDSSCAPSKEPTHPDSSKCASNSPADVPSEGRGDEDQVCNFCGGPEPCSHNFDKIAWPSPQLLPFNLSDALAGKPVVTRDGQSVRYEDCVNNIILAWIGDARMMWWDNGKFTHRSEPDPLDLFMLPTDGSGA